MERSLPPGKGSMRPNSENVQNGASVPRPQRRDLPVPSQAPATPAAAPTGAAVESRPVAANGAGSGNGTGAGHTRDTRAALLRDLVVQSALEVLERDGLGLRADSITYAKVFAYIEQEHGIKVTRGSVHERIWSSQEEFHLDVLNEAANLSSATTPVGIPAKLIPGLVDLVHELSQTDLDAYARCEEFCRRHGLHLMEEQLGTDAIHQFQALKAAARANGEGPSIETLKELIQTRSESVLTNRYKQLSFVFEAMGFKGNSRLGLADADAVRMFVQLIQIMIAGAHLDRAAGLTQMSNAVEINLPAREGSEPWTVFSLGLLAFTHLLFEPVDGRVAKVDNGELLKRLSDVVQPTDDLPGIDAGVVDASRRSRADLKRLVMTAGVELLLRDGLGLEAESLTYAAVFSHVKEETGITVHRSSVHQKIWSSQDEFRQEVLAAAARYGPTESFPRVRQALAATPEALNQDGAINRYQTVLDNTLSAATAQMKAASTSRHFARWQSIKAAMLTKPADEDYSIVDEAFSQSQQGVLSQFVQTFGSMFSAYGLRVDPELGLRDEEAHYLLAILANTMAVGADFDASGGVEITQQPIQLPRMDGSDEVDEWPPLAVAMRAFWELLFVWHRHS